MSDELSSNIADTSTYITRCGLWSPEVGQLVPVSHEAEISVASRPGFGPLVLIRRQNWA